MRNPSIGGPIRVGLPVAMYIPSMANSKTTQTKPAASKAERFAEAECRELDYLLDAIHGGNRPAQLAGHYGNGAGK